jgi:hypothetical protein
MNSRIHRARTQPGDRANMIGHMRSPCERWRWPKTRSQGLTGRVGAGLNGPGLPRDEARFSSYLLGRNPPSGRPALLNKTSDSCQMVALSDSFLLRPCSDDLARTT